MQRVQLWLKKTLFGQKSDFHINKYDWEGGGYQNTMTLSLCCKVNLSKTLNGTGIEKVKAVESPSGV